MEILCDAKDNGMAKSENPETLVVAVGDVSAKKYRSVALSCGE
jgi:hypothetical protein